MSREMAARVAGRFGLDQESEGLLIKNIRSLDRWERRLYFGRIKPLEPEIKCFISDLYRDFEKEGLIRETVDSMLARRGDPDLVDGMVMNVVGRVTVYKNLRERAEKEGVKLSALTNFGGLSMVLYAVVIITAIILYLKNV